MATYFGYVEREADSYVNWADVGRNMSATIDNIQRVRDEKKALIEKAYNEDLDYIQSRPSGEHETINSWSLNFGNTSAENLKLKYSQLKQGKISVNDFVRFRQNLTDSVEKIYTVSNQLQQAFKEVNDRTKAGENQLLERQTKVLLEKYGKLEETLPYVNGLTGTVAIGLTEITKDAEGKEVRRLRQGEDAYLTPNELQAAAMQKFDAYNEQADLDKWVEGTGAVVQDLREIGGETLAGLITSVTDVTSERVLSLAKELPEGSKLSETQMKALEAYVADFKEGEMGYINGILANPYQASALLTDRIKSKNGKTYNIVFNKDDQKTEYDLYVEKTPEGKFTPIIDENTEAGKAQKQVLVDFLQGQLRVKYDRKVEMKPYNEPQKPREPRVQASAAEIEAGGRARTASAMGSYIKDLWTGDMATKQVTLRTLQGEPGVDPSQTYFYTGDDGSIYLHVTKSASVDPSQPSTNIRMTQSDGVTPYGNIIDFGRNAASWIYGDAINRQILTQNLPQFESILNANPNFNPFNMKLKEDELWDVKFTPPKKDPLESITSNLPLSVFGKKQDDAVTEIQNALGGLGFTAEALGYASNYVKITPPEGSKLEPIKFYVNWTDKSKREEVQADVIKLVKQWYEEQARNKPQQQQTPKTDKYNK